jgi:CRP/FNR family cyclic AMP-dependent transcriptional regulator
LDACRWTATSDTLLVLLSSSAKVFVTEENGSEMVLGTVHACGYVGELFLDGRLRSASVVALETTVCSVIPSATWTACWSSNWRWRAP